MAAPDYVYADAVNANLLCPVCADPFVDPCVLRPCGHTFCRACIDAVFAHGAAGTTADAGDGSSSSSSSSSSGQGRTVRCPVDRTTVCRAEDVVPAGRVVANLVNELRVHCANRRDGCTAVVERQLLAAHLDKDCACTTVACRNAGCTVTTPRGDADAHQRTCPRRTVPCRLCRVPIVAADEEVRLHTPDVSVALSPEP